MNTNSSIAASPTPTPTLCNSVNELKSGLQEVWCRIDTLEQAMLPALGPSNTPTPGTEFKGKTDKDASPMACALDELHNDVNNIIRRLARLVDRCEL